MIGELTSCYLSAVAQIGFEKYSRGDLQFFLNHNLRKNLGWWCETKLAGFGLGILVSGELDIIALSVHPSYRRKGAGMAIVCYWLADPSVTRVFLEVDPANTAAKGLYERCGFVQTGVRKNYYEGVRPAITMQCLALQSRPEFGDQFHHYGESWGVYPSGKRYNENPAVSAGLTGTKEGCATPSQASQNMFSC